jgi:hypothetical protein
LQVVWAVGILCEPPEEVFSGLVIVSKLLDEVVLEAARVVGII